MLNVKYELVENRKEKPDFNKLGFGKYFTDHMFIMDYDAGMGWHDARVVPYQCLSLDPACMVFHYAQEMFEGLKAYRTPDGGVQLMPISNPTQADTVDKVTSFIERTPDLLERIKKVFISEKKKKNAENTDVDNADAVEEETAAI